MSPGGGGTLRISLPLEPRHLRYPYIISQAEFNGAIGLLQRSLAKTKS